MNDTPKMTLASKMEIGMDFMESLPSIFVLQISDRVMTRLTEKITSG